MSNGEKVFDAMALSSARRGKDGHNFQRAFAILLFAVFVIVDLLALASGASSYGTLNAMQRTNDNRIMTLGPIISSVRATDANDSIRRSDDAPEGHGLVLVEHDAEGTYETRIYLYEGNIMQEYALQGSPYMPKKAVVLAPSSTFDFTYDRESGLLSVTTDAGSASIALRNRQGGA